MEAERVEIAKNLRELLTFYDWILQIRITNRFSSFIKKSETPAAAGNVSMNKLYYCARQGIKTY